MAVGLLASRRLALHARSHDDSDEIKEAVGDRCFEYAHALILRRCHM
jgi:hypothetical protein